MISKFKSLALAACALCFNAAADDVVTMSDGQTQLSGTLLAGDSQNGIDLRYQHAEQALRLNSAAIKRIQLHRPESPLAQPMTSLELANGDQFPVTVESFNGEILHVDANVSGKIQVPRSALYAIQNGIRKPHSIWRVGGSNKELTLQGSDPDSEVEIEQNRIVFNGPGWAMKKLALPKNFTLRFTLQWQEGETPSWKIYFADPIPENAERADRYYLQFNGAGLEIKRETTRGENQYISLIVLNRLPKDMPNRQLEVELDVDRQHETKIKLWLNGEPEGEYADPLKPSPSGNAIRIESIISKGSTQSIKGFELLEYQGDVRRNRNEKRGDTSSDSLITRDDDRWSGVLESISNSNTGAGRVYRFMGHGQDKPVEIPELDVSTLFIAGTAEMENAAPPKHTLQLQPYGKLSAESYQIDENLIRIKHPLLGAINLHRSMVKDIEHKPEPDKAAP